MRNHFPCRILFCLVILLAASTASAGPRDHADGFFLRLSAGGGSATSSFDDGYEKLEFSGSASDVNFAIGAMVMPNLAIHGTLFGWMIDDPKLKINGTEEGKIPGDLLTTGFGAGLTYYIMPANLYLSGSLGTGTMELDLTNSNLKGETDSGIILDLTLGKEWWVGDKWALGAAFGAMHHSFSEPQKSPDWTGWSYALRFTATMN